MKHILFEAIVGSQSFGTNVETSDVDIARVYKLDVEDYLKPKFESVIVHGKGDENEYEIGKFISMCFTGNPTVLSILFSPERCVLKSTPLFDELRAKREFFITKQCRNPFTGYAFEQVRKAENAQRYTNFEKLEMKRLNPIDFVYVILDSNNVLGERKSGVSPLSLWLSNKNLTQFDVVFTKLEHTKEGHQIYLQNNPRGITASESCNLRVSDTPKGSIPLATCVYNEDAYRKHCKEYNEYEKAIKNRNRTRYVENGESTIDVKNLMHTVRLVNMAFEVAEGKGLLVDRTNIDADYLLKIRKNELDLKVIFEEMKIKIDLIKEAFEKSSIPDECPLDYEELVVYFRKNQI